MIRAVFFGYGNTANAVIEAVQAPDSVQGIWHERVGGAHIRDVHVVGVFDVDSRKTAGGRLSVMPGLELDDPPAHVGQSLLTTSTEAELADRLSSLKPDVAVNLISSGQSKSSAAYARVCAKLGIPFANATSSPVATDGQMQELFRSQNVPLAGDDLMSQLGGTVLHKGIIDFLASRGVKVSRSYQLDVGGSADTLNTIKEEVRAQKREIKSGAIAAELEDPVETVAGTTDYVEFLGSRRTVYLWLEATGPLGVPYTMDVFFKSSDPANGLNIVLDVVRGLAFDARRRRGGISDALCGYAFKNPPSPVKSRTALEAFEKEYAR